MWVLSNRAVQGQAPDPLPSAKVKIWDAVGNGLGFNPDQSRADFTGVTAQVATAAAPLTIVTVYENTICPGGPCGITFWNPVTNLFKCFGVTGGFQAASAVNLTGAVKTSISPSPATFQPGDAWASGPTGVPIYVVFKGTSSFRGYSVGSPFGITVDQTTSDVWFAQDGPGAIQKLDPATNMRTSWAVGGVPRYITQDAAGRVFVTVDGLNQIVRLDPAKNRVARWVVPTPGALGSVGETPDGITVDADGNVWFAESGTSKIGRLSAGPDGVLGTADDVICEFTKSGLLNPQLVESTGSDAPAVFAAKNLQVFFTEGTGNAVGILTQKEALGGASSVFTCATVPPSVSTVTPTTDTVSAFDFTRTPRVVTIPPTTFTIPGVNGMTDATGTTMTAAGERIPGILRFPLGSTGNSGPSGLTQVAAANTVFGSFFNTHRLWGVTSAAIIPPPPTIMATTLAFTAASATTSDFDDAATVQARLTKTSDGTPVPGEMITFTLGSGSGAPTCSATTDATGTATCSLTPNQPAGPQTLTATFAGDSTFGPSSASTTFTVTKEETVTKFTATSPTVLANGTPATFSATLKEDGVTPISGRTLTFTLGSGAGAQSCSGTTNASGTASCTIVVNQPLGPNTVKADFASDAFFKPSSDTEAVLVFAFPTATGAFVIGDLADPLPIVGDSVTWWSSQWVQLNPMSGGPAPASMKGFAGFEDNPLGTPRTCGSSWTTDTGNATPPPPSVPTFMGVLVSSIITQNGSVITGNIKQVVVVHNNPGYAPDPGNPGTGTIVAIVCVSP
jgi:hypothetical protein